MDFMKIKIEDFTIGDLEKIIDKYKSMDLIDYDKENLYNALYAFESIEDNLRIMFMYLNRIKTK